jgi:Ca2+-transporting ATPase
MALAMLLLASAAFTAGLTMLRQAVARWIVLGTLASVVVLVQIPAISHFLSLRPLHAADWALVAMASALVAVLTFGLAARLKHHLE